MCQMDGDHQMTIYGKRQLVLRETSELEIVCNGRFKATSYDVIRLKDVFHWTRQEPTRPSKRACLLKHPLGLALWSNSPPGTLQVVQSFDVVQDHFDQQLSSSFHPSSGTETSTMLNTVSTRLLFPYL